MTADLRGFDAREVEQLDTFEPIPAGKYIAAIVSSEMKPTKAGDGAFLEVQFQILDGEHKGRLLWARLNLENKNPLAVKLARAELASICQAVSVMTPNDSSELHDLPLQLKVGMKRREDTGELTNEIRGYARKPAPGQTPQANGDTPPWRRG
jgi:hypothetical protein